MAAAATCGSASHSLVESATSLRRNVTTPVGRAVATLVPMRISSMPPPEEPDVRSDVVIISESSLARRRRTSATWERKARAAGIGVAPRSPGPRYHGHVTDVHYD